jgi:isocitrate/isopropylmalate dehydrogenase
MPKVVVLPGNGVNPEVIRFTLQVFNKLALDLEYEKWKNAQGMTRI